MVRRPFEGCHWCSTRFLAIVAITLYKPKPRIILSEKKKRKNELQMASLAYLGRKGLEVTWYKTIIKQETEWLGIPTGIPLKQ